MIALVHGSDLPDNGSLCWISRPTWSAESLSYAASTGLMWPCRVVETVPWLSVARIPVALPIFFRLTCTVRKSMNQIDGVRIMTVVPIPVVQ